MKTPMNVFDTAMKKKNKNRKGFSLVELIVVLVIMAILVAALVPSLVGYIRQARQSTAKDECSAVVSAAQTIVSSAYADPSSIYHNNSDTAKNVKVSYTGDNGTMSVVDASGAAVSGADAKAVVKDLAEVTGEIVSITIVKGVVTKVEYNTENDQGVTYDNKKYTASGKITAAG